MPSESLTVQSFRRPVNMYNDMPPVPTWVESCVFGKRLTEERWLAIKQESVLSPEEKKIANQVLMNNEMSLAWTDDKKGMFKSEYIPPLWEADRTLCRNNKNTSRPRTRQTRFRSSSDCQTTNPRWSKSTGLVSLIVGERSSCKVLCPTLSV